MEILPSILTNDIKEFKQMLKDAESFASHIHIDFCDGKFVQNETVKPGDLKLISSKKPWSFHLMVENPLEKIEDYLALSPETIFVHSEAENIKETINKIIEYGGIEIGIAIKPETSVDTIFEYLDKIQSVIILTVDPGFYGSEFKFEELTKIEQIRLMKPELKIFVDGGLSEQIEVVKEYEPDFVVSGSYIFKQGKNPKEQFANLVAKSKK